MLKIVVIIGFMIFGSMLNDVEVLSLNDFRWENRIIIVNSDLAQTKKSKQLELLMQDTIGLKDRNLLVFSVENEMAHELVNEKLYKIGEEQLTKLNFTKGSFEIILIGKDGGIKLRNTSIVQNSEIYGLIDRMPMRQAEMRRQ